MENTKYLAAPSMSEMVGGLKELSEQIKTSIVSKYSLTNTNTANKSRFNFR